MGVIIHQEPQLYTPVYNPMRFVLSSTNVAQDNFKYVVDVYVSGVSSSYVFRGTYDADPNNSGRSAPDISRILENYVSYDISHTTYDFQRCSNSIVAYEVKFGEQYGPDSNIVTYPNLTVTGLKYAWNGVLSPEDWIYYTYTSYLITGSQKILSNSPTSLNHFNAATDNHWLYFLNDSSGTVYFADIKIYDENNNQLSHARIQNSYQASATYLDKMLRVAIGTEDLLNSSALTLISGSGLLTSNPLYHHYTVQFINFAGTATSAMYTFTKQCTGVSKYGKPIRVFFFNRLGGFDPFDFNLVRRKYSDKQTETYQKNLGRTNGAAWGYSDWHRGETVYNTSITDRGTAESDWISNATSVWLQELFESPEVYLHTGDASGLLLPVVVKQKSYEVKTIAVEKCFNVSIEYTYANKRWTQRG